MAKNSLNLLGIGAAIGVPGILVLASFGAFVLLKNDILGWLFALGVIVYVVAGAIALVHRAKKGRW